MSEQSRIALFFAFLALFVLVVASQGERLDAQFESASVEDYHPSSFEWFTTTASEEKGEILLIYYEDGRKIVIRAAQISMMRFYPREISKGLGIDAPHAQLTVGGKQVRIDLPTDAEAITFFKTLFPREDK